MHSGIIRRLDDLVERVGRARREHRADTSTRERKGIDRSSSRQVTGGRCRHNQRAQTVLGQLGVQLHEMPGLCYHRTPLGFLLPCVRAKSTCFQVRA